MREKKMGMRAVLTRLLGIATVACTLVATPAVASAETQVPADTEVLSLTQANNEPVQITEPGSYVLKTAKGEVTPSMGYTIDAPRATRTNPVRIYIDGTIYVNDKTHNLLGQERWLFNIKQGSNIEFIGINNPCVSFHRDQKTFKSCSGFLTDRYYEGGYKKATGDISVSLGIGDNSQDLTLWYSSQEQKVPAISLGNTKGKLSANFSKLMIKDYVGKSHNSLGEVSPYRILEYAVPIRLFRSSFSDDGKGNINKLDATFNNCVFWNTSGDYNGAVSIVGNPRGGVNSDVASRLTATFENCQFDSDTDSGIWQTNNRYPTVEETTEFAQVQETGKCAVAGVMGVTNATVNLNNCTMTNFHSTRSSSADSTLTVDALNVARSARCNINGGKIYRYGARGNTCVVYAAGALTLSGSPQIASYWKNGHADKTNYGDKYTEADIATGTAKSLYFPKKKDINDNIPALNIASDFSVRGGYGANVWISIEETADSNGVKSRVLGSCESKEIEGVVPDGSSTNDDNSDKYEIVNLNGDLVFRETIHQHKWKVEVYGMGVRASCVGPFRNSECEYGKDAETGEPKKYLMATYKLSMSKATGSQSTELVYDGCPVKIALNKDGARNLEQMGVTPSDEFAWYQCKSQADAEAYQNGTKLKGAPTDAGYYYVVTTFKTASGQTLEGKKSFEISQRRLVRGQSYQFTLKDGGKGAGKYAYDGKEHQPVVESAKFKNGAGEWVDLVEGEDYELSARSESGLKQTEPGQYECIVIGKGNFTTDGGTTSVLTLKWEIVDVSRFDLKVTGFKGAYDGDEHGITVNVKNDPVPADMKIEYCEEGGDWTTEKPTYRNVAKYTTRYRVTASDYLTVTGKATVKISKADQDAPAGLVGNNWTTCSSKDGSISGVTKAMKYRRGSSGEYREITSDGKLPGLLTGTYYVRYAEDDNHNASADTEVKIERGSHSVADNAVWQKGDEGTHFKVCQHCKKAQVWQNCRWKYEIIMSATPEADGVRQKVCRVCGNKWYYTEPYTYVDTDAPTIYDLYAGDAYCESVSFDVFDDRDETVTVTDNGKELKADENGRYTVKAAEGDVGTEHEIVAKDSANNAQTRKIKMYAEHTYNWTTDKLPTVSEAGSKHGTCSVCGHESGAVEIPALAVKGYSGKYDGKEHFVDASELPEGAVVEYKAADGSWTNVAPGIKDASKVTVDYHVTIDGAVVEGQVTLEVTPLAITVSALNASKTYGEADPVFTYDVTSGKLVEGESLQGIEIERDDCDNVRDGGYALRLTQPEGGNPNYEITFKPGTFTIDKRELTVKWDATTEFTYDGEEHCPQADLGNVVGDDKLGAYVDGGAVKAGKHTATITELTGADKGNYKLPATGLTCEFSIKKAPKGAPVVQGVAETVSAKADGKITAVDATMEWRAKDSGEYQAVPEGVAELSGLAAGTYEVRYRADDNHEASAATKVTVATGRKLAVTLPVEQVGYKLTTDATELDWHGSATLAISIEDGYFADPSAYVVKVNEDAVALNDRGEFAVQDVEGDVKVTVEGVRKHEAVKDTWLSDGNTHWHECTCGGKVDEAAHTFTWVVDTPPTATEKGFGHKQCVVCGYELPGEEIPAAAISGYSDEYDGAYHTVNASALPEGATAEYSTDDGKTWSTAAPEIKDAGTLDVAYKVMIGGATVEGQITLEVKPRAITVTAQNASKTYGEKDPVFEWSVTSGELVKDETLELEIEREDSDDVREGGYALQLTQPEGANPNYIITFVDGTFTINQRLLTVTWGTTEFVYDGKEHCPVATLGNVIGKDDLGAFVDGSQTEVGTYTATLAELTGKAAGNYVLPAEGLTCEFSTKNAAQDAPVVQATAETVSGKKDGKITGIDATMEWRAQGAAEYQAVGKDVTELKDLAAGVYEVRYQAKANYDESPATEVTVKAGRKLVVTLPGNQVGYTLTSTATELDWHGSAKLAISIDSAYFTGKDYAVNVNDKAVKLSDDGTYELKDVEGDVNVTVDGVLKHEPDGSGWAHDAKAHWHICRCGEILDKAEHTFEWVVDKPATTEAKGERHQECTVCGEKGKTEDIAILAPTIIEGAGQAITVDTAKDLSFRSNAPIKYFKTVLVDDMEVGADNFVLTSGSTIVTLKTSFVKTLGVGEHKLSVVSTTGTAETTFTIAEAAKPTPTPGSSQTTTTTTTASSKSKKKAGKATMPSVGDGTYAMAGGVLVAGVAVLLLAYAMRRRA